MTANEQKKQITESTWLDYFNRTLFEKGIITESERNKMALRIDARKVVTLNNRKYGVGLHG